MSSQGFGDPYGQDSYNGSKKGSKVAKKKKKLKKKKKKALPPLKNVMRPENFIY